MMHTVAIFLIYAFTIISGFSDALLESEKDSNDLLLIEQAIEDSILEKTDGSNAKSIKFADEKENCYPQLSAPLTQLLKEIGHPFQNENIESIEVYSKRAHLDATGESKMYFEMVLNLNQPVDCNLEGKKIVKTFKSTKQSLSLEDFLSMEYLKTEYIKSAKLSVLFKNFKKVKRSKMEILLEIGFGGNTQRQQDNRNDNFTNGITELLSIIPNQYILQRNQWKKEPFKFVKFSSSSTQFGIVLAVSSCALCGLSFVLKKRSLMKLDQGKNYYEDKNWWLAHSLMVIGDILHFIAFFFTPAVLVCTLQMLMVVVVATASSLILGEKVNTYWKLAFALSLGGCLVIIVHIPKESHIYSINTFLYMVTAPGFLAYNVALLIITITMMSSCIPKWSRVNSLALTVQSAIFGSIVVTGVKGILLAFTDRFFHWLPWTCFVIVGVCLLLQLDYLNRALSYYNTLVVTTQYYVLYSALVIMASSILYEVWQSTSDETIVVIFFGFATTTMGVLIFAIFEDEEAIFDFRKFFSGLSVRNKT